MSVVHCIKEVRRDKEKSSICYIKVKGLILAGIPPKFKPSYKYLGSMESLPMSLLFQKCCNPKQNVYIWCMNEDHF